jgi:hypothetical protein
MVHEPDYTVPAWIDAPGLSYEVLDGETGVATESSASGASAARDPAYPSSMERLQALEPVRVHFAHDPAIWER